jgi:hypothetical protein
MLRMIRQLHSCSGTREVLGHFIRSLAIIGALVFVQSHPLLALQAQEQTPAGETVTVDAAGVSAPSMAADAPAELSASEDLDVQVEVVPADQKGDSKLLVQLDGDHTGMAVAGGNPTVSNLPPGVHTARLILMDGKQHPVQGGSTTVHFRVHAAPANGASKSGPEELRGAAPAPPPTPDELRDTPDPNFSLKSSPLPLIALIGFLLLIGGFLPSTRTRKVTRIVHP